MYLVIETHNDKGHYLYCINLNKQYLFIDIRSFFECLYTFDGGNQVLDKVYYSTTLLGAW